MQVIVPATPHGLHHRTVPAIIESGWACKVEPCTWPTAYFDLFTRLWYQGSVGHLDALALVEHDIEVAEGTLDSFDECPEVWCACSYDVYQGDVADTYGGAYALGCSRFRAELMAAVPDAVERAGQMDLHPLHPPRTYAVMDSTLTKVLRSSDYPLGSGRRLTVHQHFPNVTHHHRYVRAGTFPPHPRGD